MRKIKRKKEPDFWIEYKRTHPKEQYGDLKKSATGNEVRRNLRKYLIESQYCLCAYCCKQIELDNSLNEHIKPQAVYPKETMNYNNLIVSCKVEGEKVTCGAYKDNDYDEKLFVSPLDENCEEKFVFYPNGEIEGVGEDGIYTCKLLNLNEYELQRARKAQYKTCASYQNAEMVYAYFLMPTEEGKLEPYADMIQYFYKRGDFGIVEENK